MCVVGGFAATNGTPKDFSCYEYTCDGSFTIKVNG